VIVRAKEDSFLLFEQHEHALVSGEFARHWAEGPEPFERAVYAIANHDLAWKEPDSRVRWNEASGRPYSFVDHPADEKVRAYAEGLDLLEARDGYAACLCSMHYSTLLREFGKTGVEARFVETEEIRQERLRAGMPGREAETLGRNLSLLKLCDGLSLFVCLNEPGSSEQPPPYPEGFGFDGETYRPVWEDEHALRLEPNPFTGPFEVAIPYWEVGKDRRTLGGGVLGLRVLD
jgi:hypothetical protein